MEKKNKLGIALISILVLVLIILSFTIEKKEDAENDVLSDDMNVVLENATNESGKITEKEMKDHVKINMDTFFQYYQENEKRVIIFVRNGCQYCEIAEPIIKNIAYTYNIDIYAINTLEITEEERDKLIETDSFFNSLGTPTLVIVQNGKIIDSINGLTDRAHYKDTLKKNKIIK